MIRNYLFLLNLWLKCQFQLACGVTILAERRRSNGAPDFYATTIALPAAPEVIIAAATLRQALAATFSSHPALGAYVLDEQGHLRNNVVIYIDGRRASERVRLDDLLLPESTVYILQALSGG